MIVHFELNVGISGHFRSRFKNPCKLKQELIEVIASRKDSTNRFVISVSKMNEGAKLLRTILELSTPGSVPDNTIMKECLRMESPVLSRHSIHSSQEAVIETDRSDRQSMNL